jgi:hypothetical protein
MGFEDQTQGATTAKQQNQVLLYSSSLQYPDKRKSKLRGKEAINTGKDMQLLRTSLNMTAYWKVCYRRLHALSGTKLN